MLELIVLAAAAVLVAAPLAVVLEAAPLAAFLGPAPTLGMSSQRRRFLRGYSEGGAATWRHGDASSSDVLLQWQSPLLSLSPILLQFYF